MARGIGLDEGEGMPAARARKLRRERAAAKAAGYDGAGGWPRPAVDREALAAEYRASRAAEGVEADMLSPLSLTERGLTP